MQRNRKKLALDRETIRSLANAELKGVAGGISGPRGCHSKDDPNACPTPTGGVTCQSRAGNCPSGPVSACAC